MKKFYFRAAKHKCSVPGCSETKTHLLSRSRDWTGAVYLCDACTEKIIALAKDGDLSGNSGDINEESAFK